MNTIYFSPTGKTRKVVEGITKTFKTDVIDITLKINRDIHIQLSEGLTFVAVPVYAGRVPTPALETFKQLKGEGRPCVIIVTYGNRAYDDALLELHDIMTESGFDVIAAGAFVCEHSYSPLVGKGRPNAEDYIMFEEFAHQVKTIESSNVDLKIPGNRPYCVHSNLMAMSPTVDESCIKCGKCIEVCPVSALCLEKKINSNEDLCLKCQACVKACPNSSLTFNGRLDNFTEFLQVNYTSYKENEIFL